MTEVQRQVDAVLFDLGNVLVRWDPFLPFEGRRTRAEVEQFIEEVDLWTLDDARDAGQALAVGREHVARTHPDQLAMLDIYDAHFPESVPGELPGASELVADVQAAGLHAFGLTNWSAETYHVVPLKAPVVAMLTGVVVSGREGIAKPDPRLFRLTAQRFALEPHRTLFTDDNPHNVDAAIACGFLGHHYTGPDGLRSRLRDLGVPVPPAPAT